jgi:hypothetical protein
MTRNRWIRVWLAIVAVAAAYPALSRPAHAGPIKDIMCNAVGCSKGERKCADVKGEIKDPLGTGSASVTWYCYEGGGGEDSGDDTAII